jgi:hypothetical protein
MHVGVHGYSANNIGVTILVATLRSGISQDELLTKSGGHARSASGCPLYRGLFVGQCAIDISPWATAVAGFADDPISSQLA